MPKTQSALLEAMAERQVTVDGVTRDAARPVPRARDREPDRAGRHVPAARGAARPLLPQDRARLPEHRRGDRRSFASSATQHPLDDLAARRRTRRDSRARARGRGRLHRRAAPALDRRARRRDARTSSRSRSARPCARASRSSASRARGRSSTGRDYVRPDDVETALPARDRPPGRLHADVRRRAPRSSAARAHCSRSATSSSPRVTRPEPSDERELRVLSGYSLTWSRRRPTRFRSIRGGGCSARHRAARRASAAAAARTSPARGPTGPATTSGRSTGRRRRGFRRRATDDEFIVRERLRRGDVPRS